MLIYVNITDRRTDKHIKSIDRNLKKSIQIFNFNYCFYLFPNNKYNELVEKYKNKSFFILRLNSNNMFITIIIDVAFKWLNIVLFYH